MWCISKIEFSRSKRISEEHWRLVLNAFVNASEGQQDNTIVAMGSFVANEAHWKKFENRWKAFLTGNGIKWRFNASEFLAHRDQFNWHHEKHDRVTKEIAQILMKSECADLELLLTARLITNGDLSKKSLFLTILTIGACKE
jgi:hypothetical protein